MSQSEKKGLPDYPKDLLKSFFISLLFLLGAAIFIAIRWLITGEIYFFFLVTNLALAMIPYWLGLLAKFLYSVRKAQALSQHEKFIPSEHKRLFFLIITPLSLVWLVFLPNSPYIFTDFIHLVNRGLPGSYVNDRGWQTVYFWNDLILTGSFAFLGHFFGLVSIKEFHYLWRRFTGRILGWVFVVLAAVGSGYGVFLGRFERLDSVNLFLRPRDVFPKVLSNLFETDGLAFTFGMAGFIILTYLALLFFRQEKQP